VQGVGMAASDIFVYTDQIQANFWPPMRKHTPAEMGKNGTNERPGRTVIFSGSGTRR